MSNTPDNKDDLVARLAKLEDKLDEINRKTLNNISVTDPSTQVKMLEIDQDAAHSNRARIRIRDSAGDVLLNNDTVTGWGLAAPQIPYAMYPFDSRSPLRNTGGSYGIFWNSGQNIYSPKITYAFTLEISSGGTGQFKFTWFNNAVETTIFEVSLTTTNNNYQGTYTFPSNIWGAGTSLNAYCRVSAGVDGTRFAAITPFYVLSGGQ